SLRCRDRRPADSLRCRTWQTSRRGGRLPTAGGRCSKRALLSPGSFVRILRRRFADAPDDARVRDSRDGLLDPLNLNLMKPVVAQVEPVTEHALRRQAQVIQLGRACVSRPLLPGRPVGNPVVGPFRVEGPFAELKLVQMLLPAVIRLENGLMEVLKRLVAAD